MMKELFVNGELVLNRKDTHVKTKRIKSLSVTDSRVGEHNNFKGLHYFDIRNAIDVKGLIQEISANWSTYVSQVYKWIQRNPVKKMVVTGIFTVVFSLFVNTVDAACIQEYTYQVKSGEKIEDIALRHGVTPQEILEANGLSSIVGKKILLPKVQDRMVTATTLNIRTQPSIESSIMGTYKKGDVVKVSFVENGWAGILEKGRVYFVKANYLTSNTSIPGKIANTKMYVTASSLRVREGASVNSLVLGSLKLNDQVSVISTFNGWTKIKFNSKVAFVSEKYLARIEPVKTKSQILKNNVSSSEYVIKRNDTYTKISKTLGISVASIQSLNPTVDSTRLKIGQKIKIPTTIAPPTNQINVVARIGGVDSKGTFRFITPDGSTYFAKATGNMINDLIELQGEKLTLTLEGNRGQQLKLVTMH